MAILAGYIVKVRGKDWVGTIRKLCRYTSLDDESSLLRSRSVSPDSANRVPTISVPEMIPLESRELNIIDLQAPRIPGGADSGTGVEPPLVEVEIHNNQNN